MGIQRARGERERECVFLTIKKRLKVGKHNALSGERERERLCGTLFGWGEVNYSGVSSPSRRRRHQQTPNAFLLISIALINSHHEAPAHQLRPGVGGCCRDGVGSGSGSSLLSCLPASKTCLVLLECLLFHGFFTVIFCRSSRRSRSGTLLLDTAPLYLPPFNHHSTTKRQCHADYCCICAQHARDLYHAIYRSDQRSIPMPARTNARSFKHVLVQSPHQLQPPDHPLAWLVLLLIWIF